jgi:hypothetical protein
MFTASCHCGDICFQVPKKTLFAAICHCKSCRQVHSASFVPLIAYKLDSAKRLNNLLNELINLNTSNKSTIYKKGTTEFVSCKTCSTTVCTKVKHLNYVTIPISILSVNKNMTTELKLPVPKFHMHYEEGLISCFDSLTKYACYPPLVMLIKNDKTEQKEPKTITQFKYHGRSKPTENLRNCAVETSGHYASLLRAYDNSNKTNNPNQEKNGKWKDEIHQVKCLCGHVQFQVRGSPDWTANCHCSVCRCLHGSSFVSMCGYSNDSFDIEDQIKFNQKTIIYNCQGKSMEDRYACKLCGTWVMSKLKHIKCHVVFYSNLMASKNLINKDNHHPNSRFKPSCHIFYSSGIQNIEDDLPKFIGFPPFLGGSDRVMLPNNFHSNQSSLLERLCNRESRGTMIAGCLALCILFTTPFWGNILNDEWSNMPWSAWRVTTDGWILQYKRLPTFLICEYTMYFLTIIAFIHGANNASLDLWFASWICGTANDVFFMYLPFSDNFWQAQATIMLTPRLPLYIVCMYVVLIYYSNTAARRYGLSSPIAEAMLTGLLASVLYGVYDINGPRYLWWTWHDSDAAIYERLGGAPIGSTMWILTYSCLCNLFYRWSTRVGGLNECRAMYEEFKKINFNEVNLVPDYVRRGVKFSIRKFKMFGVFDLLSETMDILDQWQKTMRSGPTAFVILFVCIACTPAFMIMLGQFSIFSLDVAGKPGIRTLSLTCVVFTLVVLIRSKSGSGKYDKGRQPSLKNQITSGGGCSGYGGIFACNRCGGGGSGDCIVGFFIIAYFLSHWWMLVSFDPTTHVSTGVHQAWSPICGNSTTYDIMGFERQDHVCGNVGPTDASKYDYTWGFDCGVGFSDTIIPNVEEHQELVEWYTVCGIENVPEIRRMVLLVFLGMVFYGRAFFFM